VYEFTSISSAEEEGDAGSKPFLFTLDYFKNSSAYNSV
jgi:hypothetical protein